MQIKIPKNIDIFIILCNEIKAREEEAVGGAGGGSVNTILK